MAAAEALFAAGIGKHSLAGRLALAVTEGEELAAVRYELCARLACSESGLRYALRTLVAAGLAVTLAAPRGTVRFRLRCGPAVYVPDERPRQQTLPFAASSEALPEEQETLAATAGRPSAGQEAAGDADAQRDCAAPLRDKVVERRDAVAPDAASNEETNEPRVSELSDWQGFRSRWPELFKVADEPPAREVHSLDSHSPIPPPPAIARDSHSPPPRAQPAATGGNRRRGSGGNVGKRAQGGNGGLIASWQRRIVQQVRIDPRYPWVAWSAALLAVEGPLSEDLLAGCIAGAGGQGGKFVAAVKRRLTDVAASDVGRLRQLTLWDDAARRVRLHRFDHLRPALARHGIQLADEATQLRRTRRRA